MLKKQLLIVFVLFWSQHSSCFLSELLSIAENAKSTLQFVNTLKSTHDTLASLLGDEDKNQEILQKLTAIDNDMNNLESYTRDKIDHLGAVMKNLPRDMNIRSRGDSIEAYVLIIEDKWKSLLQYVRQKYGARILDSLARGITYNIINELPRFRNNLTPQVSIRSSDYGFFMEIARHGKDTIDTRCNKRETYAHIMARLFPIVIITEIRGYMLTYFAYELQLSKDGTINGTLQSLGEDFQQQFLRYIRQFTEGFREASSQYLRACDPKEWKRDVNFYELEKSLQVTVYQRHNECPHWYYTCNGLARREYSDERCHLDALSNHTECDEEGPNYCFDLHYLSRDTTVCTWDDGPHRLRFVSTAEGNVGTDVVNGCPDQNKYLDAAVRSWSTEPRNFCACQCASSKWKFVLTPMRSEVADNYVIVGMQFQRHKNYIYIQIAEGKLESNGYISNFSWVTPKFDDLSSADLGSFLGHQAFFFDDLQLPPQYILTGIKLNPVSINGANGYKISIYGNRFYHGTGKLNSWDERVVSSNNDGNHELQYTAKSSTSMNPREVHFPDSQGSTHIVLRQSDLGADYGQSTVPFFDGVPIVTNPPSPIGGVGLFHKGYRDHAGFLSLRLYSIDYVHLFDLFIHSRLAEKTNQFQIWSADT